MNFVVLFLKHDQNEFVERKPLQARFQRSFANISTTVPSIYIRKLTANIEFNAVHFHKNHLAHIAQQLGESNINTISNIHIFLPFELRQAATSCINKFGKNVQVVISCHDQTQVNTVAKDYANNNQVIIRFSNEAVQNIYADKFAPEKVLQPNYFHPLKPPQYSRTLSPSLSLSDSSSFSLYSSASLNSLTSIEEEEEEEDNTLLLRSTASQAPIQSRALLPAYNAISDRRSYSAPTIKPLVTQTTPCPTDISDKPKPI